MIDTLANASVIIYRSKAAVRALAEHLAAEERLAIRRRLAFAPPAAYARERPLDLTAPASTACWPTALLALTDDHETSGAQEPAGVTEQALDVAGA